MQDIKDDKKHKSGSNRFILMLDNGSRISIDRVQKELQVKLTSSAALSAKVKAEEVLRSDNGIYYKNIGIAVVDKVEPAQLIHTTSLSNNKIYHWEEDRVYRKAGSAFEHLDKIKKQLQLLNEEVKGLEASLETIEEKASAVKDHTWGIAAMGIPASGYTGKGVDIGILDTGFYLSHPDFKGRSIIGKSFIEGAPWEYDGDGHGTHCAGTATGHLSMDSGLRYGVACGANIVIGKVLSDEGYGTTSSIIDAIDWALEKKFKILSMSLASPVEIGEKPSPVFEQIGQKALAQNTLIIAAAGNDSSRPGLPRPVSSPANADSIMAVGAVDDKLQIAGFSNGGINAGNGGKVDLVGPGVHVFSSYSKNAEGKVIYKYLDGTSMAAPHIAGLAALYWEAEPRLTAEAVWERLESKALKLDNLLKRDAGFGFGHFST